MSSSLTAQFLNIDNRLLDHGSRCHSKNPSSSNLSTNISYFDSSRNDISLTSRRSSAERMPLAKGRGSLDYSDTDQTAHQSKMDSRQNSELLADREGEVDAEAQATAISPSPSPNKPARRCSTDRGEFYVSLEGRYRKRLYFIALSGILLFLLGVLFTFCHFLDLQFEQTIREDLLDKRIHIKAPDLDWFSLTGPVMLSCGMLVSICASTILCGYPRVSKSGKGDAKAGESA